MLQKDSLVSHSNSFFESTDMSFFSNYRNNSAPVPVLTNGRVCSASTPVPDGHFSSSIKNNSSDTTIASTITSTNIRNGEFSTALNGAPITHLANLIALHPVVDTTAASYRHVNNQNNSNTGLQVEAGACEALPTDFLFVPFLATVYEHLVKLTPPCKTQITRFHAIKPPDISIKDYLNRIRRYFGCSNECFVLSLVYIDRIVKMHEDFSVSILNVHRLLITSIMLAAKFFDDVYYSNAFYARVGGVRTREINILEAHFLSLLDFHLFVSPEEYDQYRQNVIAVQLHRSFRAAACQPALTNTLTTTSPDDMQSSENDANTNPNTPTLSTQQQVEIQADEKYRKHATNDAATNHRSTASNGVVCPVTQDYSDNYHSNYVNGEVGWQVYEPPQPPKPSQEQHELPNTLHHRSYGHVRSTQGTRQMVSNGSNMLAQQVQSANEKHDIQDYSVPIERLSTAASSGSRVSGLHSMDSSLVAVTW